MAERSEWSHAHWRIMGLKLEIYHTYVRQALGLIVLRTCTNIAQLAKIFFQEQIFSGKITLVRDRTFAKSAFRPVHALTVQPLLWSSKWALILQTLDFFPFSSFFLPLLFSFPSSPFLFPPFLPSPSYNSFSLLSFTLIFLFPLFLFSSSLFSSFFLLIFFMLACQLPFTALPGLSLLSTLLCLHIISCPSL